jgi:hypothetical protein
MANEFTTTNPDNRRLTNFPYGVTSRGLSVATAIDIGDFGYESNSTAAQTTAAINAAIAFAYANGYGVVLLPPRRLPVEDGIVLYSNVVLRGYGVGITVLVAQSSLSGTDNLITNVTDTIADLTTRTDKNFGIEHLTIDASAAAYVTYPTSGYNSAGSLIRFRRAINCFVRNCEFLDFRQGYAIRELGCLNADFSSNKFERCGKGDFSSGGISSTPYGSNRIIRSISKANPCVITLFESHAITTSVYLSDIRGMSELTTGTYTIQSTTSTTITLSGIDSSAYTTYVLDPNSRVSTTSTIESEGTTIRNNTFKDMYRLCAQTSGIRPTMEGNVVNGAGEAAFFAQSARSPIIRNNRIKGVTLTDIVGSGIEVDYVQNAVIDGNIIESCEGNGIRAGGMIGGSVSNNQIRECGVTAGLTYPVRPGAVAAGIDSDPVSDEIRRGIIFINQSEFPCRGIACSFNTFIENRNGAAALMTGGVYINKSGVNSMNGPISVYRPDFSYFSPASATWVEAAATSIAAGVWVDYIDPAYGTRIVRDLLTGTVQHELSLNTDGATDQASAINASVAAMATPHGGTIKLPSGTIAIASTIAVNTPNILFEGQGSDIRHTANPQASEASTILKWIGSTNGTMLQFSSVSGAGNNKMSGGGIDNIYFDCASLAGYAVRVVSYNLGVFNRLMVFEPTVAGIELDVVASLSDAAGCQHNLFSNCQVWASSAGGIGLRLKSSTDGQNPSFNVFLNTLIQHKDGIGIYLGNCDNNHFTHTKIGLTAAGTGNAVEMHGSNSAASYVARSNVFDHISAGAGIVAKGTATYTYPAYGNSFLNIDKDNNTPEPTAEAGVYWGNCSSIDGRRIETTIASAATCDIGTVPTELVQITGTTGITSFGTAQRRRYYVRMAGVVVITYNVTSLVCPGAANITTAANDTFWLISNGSGNWRISGYSRAASAP